MPIYDVFISYRRSDGKETASALAEYLRQSGLRVFFDLDEIKDSEDFKNRILSSLPQAPNYLLIASNDAFKFRRDEASGKEDWLLREMELACKEFAENDGVYSEADASRVITVVCPRGAEMPPQADLPEEIRPLSYPNRIELCSNIPTEDECFRILRALTKINRHNVWNASHRFIKESSTLGGRFSSLDIRHALFPNAEEIKERGEGSFSVHMQRDGGAVCPIEDVLSQENKHIYLIGQGGIGKTTALVNIMRDTYEDRSYEQAKCVPIFISLSSAPEVSKEGYTVYNGEVPSFIRRQIFSQVRGERTEHSAARPELGLTDSLYRLDERTAVDPVNELFSAFPKSSPEYLLLLDGLNEVPRTKISIDGSEISVIELVIAEINWLMESCPNIRIIMTGRADENTVSEDSISRYHLCGIDEDSISEYLSGCGFGEDRIKRILSVRSLSQTLRIPLFLVLFASLSSIDGVYTRGEIFHAFFNEKSSHLKPYTVQGRLNDTENALSPAAKLRARRISARMQCFMLDFLLPAIAEKMEKENRFTVSKREISDVIFPILLGENEGDICGEYGEEVFTKYRGASSSQSTKGVACDIINTVCQSGAYDALFDPDPREEKAIKSKVVSAVIDCLVLSLGILTDERGRYRFIHQHIRDYFASQKTVNDLTIAVYALSQGDPDTAYACTVRSLESAPLTPSVLSFVGESLEEHRNRPTLKDGVWQANTPSTLCPRALLSRSLNILRGRKAAGYTLQNIIRMINTARGDLSGLDLSELDFKNCPLNGMILGRKGLPAIFRGAGISFYTFVYQGHAGSINDAVLINNGKTLISCSSEDSKLIIWDVLSGVPTKTLSTQLSPNSFLGSYSGNSVRLSFCRESGLLVAATHYNIRIWDIMTLSSWDLIAGSSSELLEPIVNNDEEISSVFVSSDESTVFALTSVNYEAEYNLITFSLKSGRPLQKIAIDDSSYISASRDGGELFCTQIESDTLDECDGKGSAKCIMKVRRWDPEAKMWVHHFDMQSSVFSGSCISRSSAKAACFEDGVLRVYDIPSRSLELELNTRSCLDPSSILALSWSKDGEHLFIVTEQRTFSLSKTSGLADITELLGKDMMHSNLDMTADGKYIVAIGWETDRTAVLGTESCRMIFSHTNTEVRRKNVCFDGNSGLLAISNGADITLWEREGGGKYRYIDALLLSPNCIGASAAFTDDGKIMAYYPHEGFPRRKWSLSTLEEIPVPAFADGDYSFEVMGNERCIKRGFSIVCEHSYAYLPSDLAKQGELPKILPAEKRLDASVQIDAYLIKRIDLKNGSSKPLALFPDSSFTPSCSPDGRYLAAVFSSLYSRSEESTLHIFDLEKCKSAGTVTVSGSIRHFLYTPNGRSLIISHQKSKSEPCTVSKYDAVTLEPLGEITPMTEYRFTEQLSVNESSDRLLVSSVGSALVDLDTMQILIPQEINSNK